MEIRYLLEFAAVADALSFSDAADSLFISQATLSKHIAAMEEELGCRLLDRSTHHVLLTESGRQLLPAARDIVSRYHECLNEMDRSRATQLKTIRIASIPVMEPYHISEAVVAFQKEHPAIDLQISEEEGRDIPKLLKSGDYDLAFQRLGKENMNDYHSVLYCSDDLVAVVPPSHPFASYRSIPLARLRDDQFLFMDENTGFLPICINACRQAGFEPKITYKGHRPENILGLVAKGMGVSLLLRQEVLFYSNPGAVIISLSPPLISNIYLTNPRQVSLHYPCQLFVDFIKNRK